jgi:Flp pilus assembly protein TadG
MNSRRRNRIRSEQGQTAVEFALVAPLLLALLLGIVQGGIAFHDYLAVTDAARAAARQAIVARVSDITQADVQTAAQNAAAGLDTSGLKVVLADPTDPMLSKSGSELTVTVTYPYKINVLGWVVASGDLTSTMTGKLE